MCDRHRFQFDVDKAYADQVVAALGESPAHPLIEPQAPRQKGVYALYRGDSKAPVYVGRAVGSSGVAGRLRYRRVKIAGRTGISIKEMSCRFVLITQKWEVMRAADALLHRYAPEWNSAQGFSMHVLGNGH